MPYRAGRKGTVNCGLLSGLYKGISIGIFCLAELFSSSSSYRTTRFVCIIFHMYGSKTAKLKRRAYTIYLANWLCADNNLSLGFIIMATRGINKTAKGFSIFVCVYVYVYIENQYSLYLSGQYYRQEHGLFHTFFY